MRLLSAALVLSAVATPVAAQSRAADTARKLNDPVVQEGAAAAVSALAGILLDTRIGPLAAYSRDVRPTDTLRDLKRRDDPQFEARLHDDARRAAAAAGAVTSDALAMSGEVARTADRLRAALAPLAGLLASTGPLDDGY